MEIMEILRIIAGSIFVLFIPGLAWSFIFFGKDEIDIIERIALSFGLSIAILPLIIFYLNYLLGIRITLINSTLTILLITLIPAALYIAKNRGLMPDKLAR
jgi:uncharacterized membrane protein